MHAHSSKCISQLKKSEVIRGERDREMEKRLSVNCQTWLSNLGVTVNPAPASDEGVGNWGLCDGADTKP